MNKYGFAMLNESNAKELAEIAEEVGALAFRGQLQHPGPESGDWELSTFVDSGRQTLNNTLSGTRPMKQTTSRPGCLLPLYRLQETGVLEGPILQSIGDALGVDRSTIFRDFPQGVCNWVAWISGQSSNQSRLVGSWSAPWFDHAIA